MGYFMRQNPGQLSLIFQCPVKPLGQDNITAGSGKRIDILAFNHTEMPRKIGSLALMGYPASDLIDIFLQGCIIDQGSGAQQIAGDFASYLNLFLPGGVF
jgi:hypothetical protein